MSLEDQLVDELKSGMCTLKRGLLIASGLDTEDKIQEYEDKIDYLDLEFERFLHKKSRFRRLLGIKNSDKYVANALFKFLWEGRYVYENDKFLTTDAIDAKIEGNDKIGNCVALTSLYTILGLRHGLDVGVLASKTHVLNTLDDGNSSVLIENTSTKGFNESTELIKDKLFKSRKSISLVAMVLSSLGGKKSKNEELDGAIKNYNKALEIDSESENIYCNRAIAKIKLKDYTGAMQDCNKVLEIDPEYGKAYAVRGEIKIYIDDYAGAIKDLNKAFEIDSEDADIYNNRGIAKKGCGDYAGAIQDLNKAFEIDPGNELIKNNLEYIKKEAIKNV
jgi:tetratricopeptide (TPR) repeat protein